MGTRSDCRKHKKRKASLNALYYKSRQPKPLATINAAGKLVLVANAKKAASLQPQRLDPTRTGMIRRKWAAEIERRFNRFKKAVRKLIVEENAFGLGRRSVTGNYDPDQPRDDDGKWTDAGGGSSGSSPSYSVEFKPSTPADFVAARDAAAKRNPFLTKSTAEDLKNHKIILSVDGKVGAVVSPEGDIQNVFNNGGPKGAGQDALYEAIRQGGTHLDCFDDYLPGLYNNFGFEETGRMKFNRDYAPEGWDYDKYGEPDVVFMALKEGIGHDVAKQRVEQWQTAGKPNPVPVNPRYYDGDTGYDSAKADSISAAVSAGQGKKPGPSANAAGDSPGGRFVHGDDWRDRLSPALRLRIYRLGQRVRESGKWTYADGVEAWQIATEAERAGGLSDGITSNVYCATGEGGGKDPTCSPGPSGDSADPMHPRAIETNYEAPRPGLRGTYPGHNFVGPNFNYDDSVKPVNHLDALAKEHDRMYKEIRKRYGTLEAFGKWNHADEWMFKEMRKIPARERSAAWRVANLAWQLKRALAPVSKRLRDTGFKRSQPVLHPSEFMLSRALASVMNENCGTGAGGFQEGNTCAKGDGVSYESLGDMPGNLEEDLDYITQSDDPSDERVQAVLEHYNCEPVRFMGDELPGVYSNGTDVVEWSGGDASVSEAGEFVYQYDMTEIEAKYEDQFNDDFWSGPGPVFHATQDENGPAIEESGLSMADDTRGMSNRGSGAAVYTTAEWEEAISGSYGDTIFEIDAAAMARDGYKPMVRQEPDVVRGELVGALASALGDDNFNYDYEAGMSPNTIVFYGHIPPQYLKNVSPNR